MGVCVSTCARADGDDGDGDDGHGDDGDGDHSTRST